MPNYLHFMWPVELSLTCNVYFCRLLNIFQNEAEDRQVYSADRRIQVSGILLKRHLFNQIHEAGPNLNLRLFSSTVYKPVWSAASIKRKF